MPQPPEGEADGCKFTEKPIIGVLREREARREDGGGMP